MFRQPPPESQEIPAAEGSSDPTIAERLRTWVEILVPQILTAKDVQSLLVAVLSSIMTAFPVFHG